MTTAVVTGYGRAVGVFDMDPEFPVRESNARRAVQTRQGAGVSHRRQDARSAGDVDFEAQVRSWTLEWSQATKTEADQLREYYRATRAGGAFLLYYPPRETGASNLCPFGESFDSTVWKRGTVDTALSAGGTSLPAGVGGSAYLLENGGSATTPPCHCGPWRP